MTRIVVAANVFVSAILTPGSTSARGLDIAKEGKAELLLSESIISEIIRVLKYPKIAKRHKLSHEALNLMDEYIRFATMTPGQMRVKIVKEDPRRRSIPRMRGCSLSIRHDLDKQSK